MQTPVMDVSPTSKAKLGELSDESILSSAWRQMSEPAKVVESQPQVDDFGGSFDDVCEYEPGCFLRQLSEPAKFSSAPTTPIGLPPGIRVKNTFLDFGDFELDNFRHAKSPAKIAVGQQGGGETQCLSQKGDKFTKLGSGEGEGSTNGSEVSNHTASATTSVPGSPLSKPATPESESPRMDPMPPIPPAAALPLLMPHKVVGQQETYCPHVAQTAHTLTIHGLPRECTTRILTEELSDAGFKSERDYDFLFVPRDVGYGSSLGSAFINLKSYSLMRSFMSAFQGRRLRYVASDQVLTIVVTSFKDLVHVTGQHGPQAASAAVQPRFCTTCGMNFGSGGVVNFCGRCGTPVGR